ncbi:ABC transporter permease [Nocardioides plantarum]|uniref:ABC transporter permease n=1 Tax=Nocardioides plantarum TaxID=29299 RepID=A0ABV5KFH3_9ACTN|nr:ABC transporter permease [Nocardioides plantarum]
MEPPPGEKKVAGKSPTRIAFDRLRKDKVAVVCTIVVILLVIAAAFAPLINKMLNIYGEASSLPYSPTDVLYFGGPNNGLPNVGPPVNGFTADHPLGLSPGQGLDNLARLLLGLRTSLLIATLATVISTIVGVVIGLVAGFSRGWLDRLLMFTTDLFLSFPFILGAMAMAPILRARFNDEDIDGLGRAQLIALIVILVFFGWMGLARLIRGQVLSLREREFIQAAQVIGVPTRQILFKELLPNMVAPIIVSISLSLPAFVTAEAGLSYLGIGLTGQPSLGQTIFDAQNYFEVYPLYLWAPVVTITILVLALNLLGDAIRDAFDPKTRR